MLTLSLTNRKHIILGSKRSHGSQQKQITYRADDRHNVYDFPGGFARALPSSMSSCTSTLRSLNHPGISTLQPYAPKSLLCACRMVRDTSPSVSPPRSRYLWDRLNCTVPSEDERMVLEHLNLGTFARPQQTSSTPWVCASYRQGKVTLCPMMAVTVDTPAHAEEDRHDLRDLK